jgi:hypothetical protein
MTETLVSTGSPRPDESLKINKSAEAIRAQYKTSSSARTTNFIIYGGTGSGKTSLLRSCRTPVLLDSFDPGGGSVLEGPVPWSPYDSCIDNGKILVDTRFEGDDPAKPTKFELWDKVYQERKRDKFFDLLGTYALDLTSFSQAVMNYVINKYGRSGNTCVVKDGKPVFNGVPQQQDYLPQMVYIEAVIQSILSYDCDVVLIGHDSMVKDDVTGMVMKDLMITGKLTRRIPLLFSEMYHAEVRSSATGNSYELLTTKTGTYQAKTRMGKGGELAIREPGDIKAMLKKCNRNFEDKPAI